MKRIMEFHDYVTNTTAIEPNIDVDYTKRKIGHKPVKPVDNPKPVYVEGKDYPVIKVGDIVKVVIDEQRQLTNKAHKYLLSKPFFKVIGIGDPRKSPSIDIGYKTVGFNKPFYYSISIDIGYKTVGFNKPFYYSIFRFEPINNQINKPTEGNTEGYPEDTATWDNYNTKKYNEFSKNK